MNPIIYLFFKGNCYEAMSHYVEVLGGSIENVLMNSDAPSEDRMAGGADLVMNMSVQLGQVTVMASDLPDEMYERPQGFRVAISPTSRAEFDRIHEALATDAVSVEIEPHSTFWAERFAMFTDRFGTPWIMNFESESTNS